MAQRHHISATTTEAMKNPLTCAPEKDCSWLNEAIPDGLLKKDPIIKKNADALL